jgi:acetyl-CoA carboxylase biotin carboxyl carrier protein
MAAPSPAPVTPSASPSHEPPKEKPSDPTQVLVKSPIVGTFYEGPAPGAPPFVQVGSRVQPGQVLCIIESMKLMNEIESETAGIVEAKLVMNGQPVEYGEALFAVRTV